MTGRLPMDKTVDVSSAKSLIGVIIRVFKHVDKSFYFELQFCQVVVGHLSTISILASRASYLVQQMDKQNGESNHVR